jgi:hydroxymethylbilane synthase
MDKDAPLRIGTRGSPLALAQAEAVKAALAGEGRAGEIVTVSTRGDRRRDVPLAQLGGKGVWTKELERALLDGEIDLAVHSLKDVESVRPDGLLVAATLPRADVRERLIGVAGLDALTGGMRVGTSSPRRAAQLLRRVPGLVIEPLRGNVATRLKAIKDGAFDATLLAAAGLSRLRHDDVGSALTTEDMLPAPGQAAIAIEARADDAAVLQALAAINHAETFTAVTAERAVSRRLGGSCHSPVAALARRDGEGWYLRAEILSLDGADLRSAERRFAAAGAEAAGTAMAEALLAGAPDSIARLFGGA